MAGEPARGNTLAVQGWIAAAFLLFILLTSEPVRPAGFRRPSKGTTSTRVLQDLGLAIHPPLLYLGYVGFSIVFSFAAAALISGRLDAGLGALRAPLDPDRLDLS